MARAAVPASLRNISLQNHISLKSFLVTLVSLFVCFAIYISWLAFHPDAPKQFAKMAEGTALLEIVPQEVATPAAAPQSTEPLTTTEDPLVPPSETVEEVATAPSPAVPATGLVITDVGFSAKKFDLIKRKLPKGTTLIMDPHVPAVAKKISEAVQHSFVVKLKLPLQPTEFPYKDAGALALMVKDSPETMSQKLDKLSAIGAEASGFILPASSAFDKAPEQKQAVMKALSDKMIAYEDAPAKTVSVNAPEFLDLVK